MVPTLIESARKTDKQRILGTAVVSFTIHAGVIAGAVFATLQAKGIDQTVKMDTTMVLLTPQQQPRPELQPAQLDVPVRGFQTVVVPPEIPTDIPRSTCTSDSTRRTTPARASRVAVPTVSCPTTTPSMWRPSSSNGPSCCRALRPTPSCCAGQASAAAW